MGKSISTSLEDDDGELIRTTPGMTPNGPKLSLQSQSQAKVPSRPRTMRRQQSTQESPPSSIFKPNPLILSAGYLRDIIKLNVIPNSICILCSNYCRKKYKSLQLDSNKSNSLRKRFIIRTIDDNPFNEISMGHDTIILGKKPIIKISSMSNLKMDWNSKILFDTQTVSNSTIILTVFGDINMGQNTKLLCGQHGNIYIQCENLIMRTGSIIATTAIDNSNNNNKQLFLSSKSNLKRFGNIYMDIKKSLIMDKMAHIKSGNIKITCQQAKIGIKSSIKALRKNLEISTMNGIICEQKLKEIFSSKKETKIENMNELNSSSNVIKLEETMKENIHYKLTMFEGQSDEEFECCICWENEPNVMILPCNHSTFCYQCIKELNPTECPICRITIQDTQKF